MLQELFLSDWLAWDRRNELPNTSGIYVISTGEALSVIYIGRTWGAGGIRDRIRAFHRSATTGQKGHAGGVTYHSTLGPMVDDLCIRVHVPIAINPAEGIIRPYLDYAERRLIWEHVARFGQLPACNSE